jgi:hypothetical protein
LESTIRNFGNTYPTPEDVGLENYKVQYAIGEHMATQSDQNVEEGGGRGYHNQDSEQ